MTRLHSRINVTALYAALDNARKHRGLSWRDVAKEAGCSPSTLSRMANGNRPDADSFMSLAIWLGDPAERFWLADEHG